MQLKKISPQNNSNEKEKKKKLICLQDIFINPKPILKKKKKKGLSNMVLWAEFWNCLWWNLSKGGLGVVLGHRSFHMELEIGPEIFFENNLEGGMVSHQGGL